MCNHRVFVFPRLSPVYYISRKAKCILVTTVCVCMCVCLSLAIFLHYCTDPDVTLEKDRECPLVVHYWADLHSVHGFRCYDDTHVRLQYTTARCKRVSIDVSAIWTTLSQVQQKLACPEREMLESPCLYLLC